MSGKGGRKDSFENNDKNQVKMLVTLFDVCVLYIVNDKILRRQAVD